MRSTLTHKTSVVELAFLGLTTKEASLRIIHTPEAVGRYFRTFDQVLILLYFALPETPMGRVTGHSHLVKEHLKLEQKRFPTKEQLATYLGQQRLTSMRLHRDDDGDLTSRTCHWSGC